MGWDSWGVLSKAISSSSYGHSKVKSAQKGFKYIYFFVLLASILTSQMSMMVETGLDLSKELGFTKTPHQATEVAYVMVRGVIPH